MKHSDLKPLVAVDSLNKLTPYDVLITLIESAVKIYTINSSEKKITYDYIEDSNCEDDCTDDVVRVDIVASDFKINRHKHRKIIKLRKNIIIDIAINKQVSEIRLFNSNDKELKMSQKSAHENSFKLMTYDDLYIHKDDLHNVTALFKSKPKERSAKPRKQHLVAFEEAYEQLGSSASTKRIFSYIQKQAESRLMNLEFEGDDIQPFDRANGEDTVMKVNGGKISKKTVQNICSDLRNQK
jgi:hypothetical protein